MSLDFIIALVEMGREFVWSLDQVQPKTCTEIIFGKVARISLSFDFWLSLQEDFLD